MKHLRYFVYDASLPDHVIEAFRQNVIDCGESFTGSDALALVECARQLTRSHNLDLAASSLHPDRQLGQALGNGFVAKFWTKAIECQYKSIEL